MDISFLWLRIHWLLGLPLIIYAVGIGLICTIIFRFIQFRAFFQAWRVIIAPQKKEEKQGDMTPFQAFLNTLSTNLGNGSVVGAATAIVSGGPGAGIWVLLVGLFMMAIRFAEVYASTWYGMRAPKNTTLGGPMLYLKEVWGGAVLSGLYGVGCLIFGLLVGNAMQMHSIRMSIETTWGFDTYAIAVCITAFIAYVLFGGAQRIIAVSDKIVPVKVIVFFGASFLLIAYHSGALYGALQLMIQGAFQPQAMLGGALGFTVMQAIQAGMNLSVTATESGLGTAAILFGYTGSTDPIKSGLMGMISTFVSSLVCFLVALSIVISGVWDSGLKSSALTISAFNTVFGQWGGWIVSFLSISFGVGVVVAFAYITRAAWFSITGGKYEYVFYALYCAAAFWGSVAQVDLVWGAVAIINGTLLTINLTGLLLLMPRLARYLRSSEKEAA